MAAVGEDVFEMNLINIKKLLGRNKYKKLKLSIN